MSEQSTPTRIIEAAVSWIAETGLRKISVDEIASKASVSRATVYLHFPGRSAIIEAAVRHEVGRILARASADAERYDDRDARLVEVFAASVVDLAHHPALAAVLRHNPKILLPFVFGPDPLGIRMAREHVATLFDGGPGAHELAEMIVRTFHSFLLAPSSVFDLSTLDGARHYARVVLLPLRDSLAAAAADST
ncbi:MAG TPA: TetR/AcrR family transcriptional regulator [Acidimicrobiales bacterium]|nr:TetR/AcrR family transcriptional regulator [Acidimicrobiales bacterium]